MEEKLLMKTWYVLLMLLPLSLWAKDVVLTADQSGSSFSVQPGDMVSIQLQGNPTTGYEWEDQSKPTAVFEKKEVLYVPDSSLVGSGGVYTFHYRAVKPGKTSLTLVYRRPWEKNVSP